MKQVVLASISPRRQALLKNIVDNFTVAVSDVDETLPTETNVDETLPTETNVEEIPLILAKKKAKAVLLNHPEALVIGADTIVILDGKMLCKPADENQAYAMLAALSGKEHRVKTGVCVIYKEKTIAFTVVTSVFFDVLSPTEIANYIATKEPFDKAGGYGIQGIGSLLIKSINGDYYNVMGLPVNALKNVLRKEFLGQY